MLTCLGARIEKYMKGDTVFCQNCEAIYIGIVLEGSVQIVSIDYCGNRSIVSEVGDGGIFAEAFACAEVRSLPVSVIAKDDSQIMLIECSHILHTCSNNCGFHQTLIYNLMKDLAEKTLLYHERIEVTSKRTTREKLLTYLNILAKKEGGASFDIPFDRQELADFLEVERSGLSAEISKLRKEGIIDCWKNHFKLLGNMS